MGIGGVGIGGVGIGGVGIGGVGIGGVVHSTGVPMLSPYTGRDTMGFPLTAHAHTSVWQSNPPVEVCRMFERPAALDHTPGMLANRHAVGALTGCIITVSLSSGHPDPAP
jgi:hypothetical protein